MADKKSTIKDVAKLAGVSTTTVSYVINNTQGRSLPKETKDRVLNAIAALDYTPNAIARRMKTNDISVICFVYSFQVYEAALSNVLKGIEDYAKSQNCLIALYSVDEKDFDTGYIDHYKSHQIDGIIFYAPLAMPTESSTLYEQRHLAEITANHIPVCVINGRTNDSRISYVNMDFYDTTYKSVAYLHSLGHRRIAYIFPKESERNFVTRNERIKGFYDSMKDHMLPIEDDMITCEEELEDFLVKYRDHLPDAIVASKLTGADLFYKYANKLDIDIPNDISIISANYAYVSFFSPSLTTAYLKYEEIGQAAVKSLIESIKSHKAQRFTKIGSEIIAGDSCAPNQRPK